MVFFDLGRNQANTERYILFDQPVQLKELCVCKNGNSCPKNDQSLPSNSFNF